jgi:hypothetical protein
MQTAAGTPSGPPQDIPDPSPSSPDIRPGPLSAPKLTQASHVRRISDVCARARDRPYTASNDDSHRARPNYLQWQAASPKCGGSELKSSVSYAGLNARTFEVADSWFNLAGAPGAKAAGLNDRSVQASCGRDVTMRRQACRRLKLVTHTDGRVDIGRVDVTARRAVTHTAVHGARVGIEMRVEMIVRVEGERLEASAAGAVCGG